MPSPADTSPIVRKLVRLGKTVDSRPLFESIAHGGIAGGTTEVGDAAYALGVERWQVVQFFKRLGDTGCGRFIVGRKGHASRFEWWYESVSVAAAALGQRVDLAPLGEEEETDDEEEASEKETVIEDAEDAEDVVSDEAVDASAPSEKVVDHSYVLRANFTVRLRLPVTLKKGEAERLAAFIRTLPFEPGD
jgi:hypothetical protein